MNSDLYVRSRNRRIPSFLSNKEQKRRVEVFLLSLNTMEKKTKDLVFEMVFTVSREIQKKSVGSKMRKETSFANACALVADAIWRGGDWESFIQPSGSADSLEGDRNV